MTDPTPHPTPRHRRHVTPRDRALAVLTNWGLPVGFALAVMVICWALNLPAWATMVNGLLCLVVAVVLALEPWRAANRAELRADLADFVRAVPRR